MQNQTPSSSHQISVYQWGHENEQLVRYQNIRMDQTRPRTLLSPINLRKQKNPTPTHSGRVQLLAIKVHKQSKIRNLQKNFRRRIQSRMRHVITVFLNMRELIGRNDWLQWTCVQIIRLEEQR